MGRLTVQIGHVARSEMTQRVIVSAAQNARHFIAVMAVLGNTFFGRDAQQYQVAPSYGLARHDSMYAGSDKTPLQPAVSLAEVGA